MTTIAYDGRTVAADSMGVSGAYRVPGAYQKIRRVGERVYGLAGYPGWFDAWIRWYEDGADPKSAPHCNIESDNTGSFIVFERGRAFVFTSHVPYPSEIFAPDAWGSGCDFAIGAMKAGADARRAVEVAIDCDPHTGGEVQVIDLMGNAELRDAA